jgi:hypothetical protein
MNIYYLLRKGEDPARELDNLYGESHRIRVLRNFYEARERAFAHAHETGVRHCLIIAGKADPRWMHWPSTAKTRSLALASMANPEPRHDHALLLYARRLLRQHASAVVVPPLGALPQMRRGWEENMPLPPVVAAYRVPSVMAVDHTGPGLEYNLVSNGCRVLALSDFGHRMTGEPLLDTYGSAIKWKRAYEHTQKTLF